MVADNDDCAARGEGLLHATTANASARTSVLMRSTTRSLGARYGSSGGSTGGTFRPHNTRPTKLTLLIAALGETA
jgi:hypothetical protein